MNLTSDRYQSFYQITIYLCGFLLFMEWLMPLDVIGEFNNISIFYIYAAFCFFISFIQINWMISVPLKLVGLLFILDGLFIGERIFSSGWFTIVYDQILYNIQVIQSQQWWEMTPMFRSLLFLILLWLMSYLLFYWFIIAKRMLVFVVLTILYVTVVDTFTVYDGKWAIIRTFILAMVSLGLAHFYKEMEKESISVKSLKFTYRWVVPLVGMVILSSVLGFASPKLTPQWPDPVPYLTSANPGAGSGDGPGNGPVQKVGYGENDSRLGGGFIQDDTPVFRAMSQDEQYWRVESKDAYTGKGWEDTLDDETSDVTSQDLEFSTFTDDVETEERISFLDFTGEADFNKLIYPYGVGSISRFSQDEFSENLSFQLHDNTGEIDTFESGDPVQLEEYVVDYNMPSFEYSQLREADEEDPEEIVEQYTQLPDNLPNRVVNLGSQIVEGEDNRYDRAKAVEAYFAANDFEYETEDVEVPEGNEDYVDQFLFETQLGYCDNFSTSMVVLLRSQDIPARWVKGFTGGELTQETASVEDQNLNVYEVTSGNAHSWVEVYFPEVGWVPFEPTQGFANNADFYTEVEQSDDGETSAEQDSETEDTEENNNENPNQAQQQEEAESDQAAAGAGDDNNWTPIWITSALLIFLAAILFFVRHRLMAAYLRRQIRKKPGRDTFERAYIFLLKVFEKRKMKRHANQTLRDFANQVDARYQSSDMRQLTYHYERMLYRNEQGLEQMSKVTELWENLIKKALS
ncbi:transglutaminaseTgpA domain-containing protein [Halobacillus campisalis]|uniref:TransglutaminaseTgpA domain-containing protein n=1 Tax=Halobacillus campisalis TaxID=435909 RepID=A0ABW2K938_9BACI|nr:transglutaminase domain-containing protein [Halobacillus campisalis]